MCTRPLGLCALVSLASAQKLASAQAQLMLPEGCAQHACARACITRCAGTYAARAGARLLCAGRARADTYALRVRARPCVRAYARARTAVRAGTLRAGEHAD
eukprot:15168368-Alexandrium_andersonii.AAC.1